MTTPPWLRAVGYFALSYRRTWRGSMVTTFVTPVLYLAAMGVGLGSFVNKGGHAAALGGLSYLQFVAPGLAATTAATIGASESLFPVMAAIRWQKTYFGMLATPLRVGDVLAGHLIWIAARVASAVAAYLVVMAAFRRHPIHRHPGRLAGGRAGRHGVRGPAGRLRRPPGKRGSVPADLPPGADPVVPLLGGVLSDQPVARPACGSSPTSARCGTGSICAGSSRSVS